MTEYKPLPQDATLKDILRVLAEDKLREQELMKQKKVRKWKMPWRGRLTRSQVRRDWITVVYLQENKNVKFMKLPIDENVIEIDGVPHVVTQDEILIYRNKPLIIQPAYSERPISIKEHIKKTDDNGENVMGWKYIINYMNKTQIKAKKKMGGGGLVIILILALGGIGYYLWKSGVFS